LIFIDMTRVIKSSICLLCLIYFFGDLNGQVFKETYDRLLKHFQDTVISLTSSDNNIVHGIDNKVVVRNNLFKGEVNIRFDNKYILSKQDNYFLLRAPDLDSKENISLLVGKFKNDTIFYRTFRNEMLPIPSIYFGNVNLSATKKIMHKDIQLADSVYILFRHSLSGSSDWLKIKRFTIGYNYGSYYITYDNIGNRIAQKIKAALLGLKPGQEISISILAEGISSMQKEIPLLYFKIQ
jgi:hypothetical protein